MVLVPGVCRDFGEQLYQGVEGELQHVAVQKLLHPELLQDVEQQSLNVPRFWGLCRRIRMDRQQQRGRGFDEVERKGRKIVVRARQHSLDAFRL